MFGSLLRPKLQRGQTEPSPFAWFPTQRRVQDDGSEDDAPELRGNEEDTEWGEEDGPIESTPLLPMFSASHLGRCTIPPYRRSSRTHSQPYTRCLTCL